MVPAQAAIPASNLTEINAKHAALILTALEETNLVLTVAPIVLTAMPPMEIASPVFKATSPPAHLTALSASTILTPMVQQYA